MTDEIHDADCGCQEYNELSRRQFLGSAAVVSAASLFPAWLPKIVLAKSASTRDVIVSVFMRGGADGLSLVAPYADPAYYTSRTTIAIPRPDSASTTTRGIDLDGFFMFPQAMAALVPAYTAKDLLVTHATGQTFVSRSHFDAQRYMETGKPADPNLITGWLGRHLASIPPLSPSAPLRGIGLANGLQRTMVAPIGGTGTYAAKALPIADPTNFTIGGAASTQAVRTAFIKADYATAEEPVHSAALDATNTLALLKSVNFTGYKPANATVYPTSSFGRALRSLAVLITNNIGIEAAAIDVGGWDTHSAQNPISGSMANTMKDFSNSLAAFYSDIIATNPGVTLVCVSEFGRNVRENGSNGTDHGRGTTMFAMGKGIAGGRVLTKNWLPNMLAKENLESGQDLKVTLDYRDVLAEIVAKRLGNPNLDFVFPAWTPTMLGVTR
jgi:uncharacterized protein (DUF1501 family)